VVAVAAVVALADLGLYVYGVVPGGALRQPPALPGIDDSHAVECMAQGDLCALISRVSLDQFAEEPLREHLADMSWVERTARRHQQVLDSVLGECTPLPMRLCTLYSDEQGLRQMLDQRQHDLSAALAELSGKLEWGVQVFTDSPPGPDTDAAAQSAASGTAYLQQKLAARRAGEQASANLDAICDEVHAELGSVALASRVGTPQRAEAGARPLPMIMNAFYLVAEEQRDDFCGRFAELRDELAQQHLQLRLTGPWPPYNFMPVTVGGSRQ
jgi:hypothetical protein